VDEEKKEERRRNRREEKAMKKQKRIGKGEGDEEGHEMMMVKERRKR
jgi:hypothetical protein